MRTRLLNVLLLAALALSVARLWHFLGEPPPALPPIAAGAPAPTAGTTSREQKAAVGEYRPETYDAIVARDLFSPTRGVVAPAPVVTTTPRPLPAPKLTLYGVVVLDEEKAAYLQEGTQESRPRRVRENENFAGGVVKTINPDGITFLFSGSEIKVPLRAPKSGAEAPPPRGQAPGARPPRSAAPVEFPRRQQQAGIRQGQLPAPGRPAIGAPGMPMVAPGTPPGFPGMPMVVPPAEPGGEVFQDEEFPEGSAPGGEAPGLMEETAE